MMSNLPLNNILDSWFYTLSRLYYLYLTRKFHWNVERSKSKYSSYLVIQNWNLLGVKCHYAFDHMDILDTSELA